jgi:exopolyphosphatase/guanosine-5'-triphosphate,3'-diphosphate pyrophosphatase
MAEASPQPRPTNLDSGSERQLAALDLGSNSFHLLVAQDNNGRIHVIEKIREMVRLAEGLGDGNVLSDEVAERALDCLRRFSQRLKGLRSEDIRVVGTNTLRRARNANAFLEEAEKILGVKVEIISGREEARLIYLGVSHALEDNFDRRLVIDIGGGSTEIILGRQFEAEIMESLHVGCVEMTRRHFADGKLRTAAFRDAIDATKLEMEPLVTGYTEDGWDTAIGASGTILAIDEMLTQLNPDANGITIDGLDMIQKVVVDAKQLDKLTLPGLPAERASVFPGGLAVLRGVFESLGIKHMRPSGGALREGLLYDLIGRVHHRDVRASSVLDLTERYHIDQTHARRVRESAISLLAQVARAWQLTVADDKSLLSWAADLHEIGRDIAHSQYHKHGCYLLQHMDLAGFSRLDQQDLAGLVRAHRRKFPIDEVSRLSERIMYLAVLLRISVVLHRSRTANPLPHIHAKAGERHIRLSFPDNWLEQHPLTKLDLDQEAEYLKVIPLTLEVTE